jgi:hypothetical protein
MKANSSQEQLAESSEILILPNGQVLAHNITPQLARLLVELDPGNEPMQRRAASDGADGAADKTK